MVKEFLIINYVNTSRDTVNETQMYQGMYTIRHPILDTPSS